MLAIKESVNDMSPYVRKTAAHAIPKLYRWGKYFLGVRIFQIFTVHRERKHNLISIFSAICNFSPIDCWFRCSFPVNTTVFEEMSRHCLWICETYPTWDECWTQVLHKAFGSSAEFAVCIICMQPTYLRHTGRGRNFSQTWRNELHILAQVNNFRLLLWLRSIKG